MTFKHLQREHRSIARYHHQQSTMSIWNFGQRIHIMTYRKIELGDQVLAIAGEHQDAEVLDDVDAMIPPVPPTPLIVVAQLSTLQAYKRTHI
mmetsp:Transcript_1189/g.1913  ORF Transcript_1189/g.1913 Transcript_1189/m.1913 type:complete len:92 (+) Transcript_1189:370-645(+)